MFRSSSSRPELSRESSHDLITIPSPPLSLRYNYQPLAITYTTISALYVARISGAGTPSIIREASNLAIGLFDEQRPPKSPPAFLARDCWRINPYMELFALQPEADAPSRRSLEDIRPAFRTFEKVISGDGPLRDAPSTRASKARYFAPTNVSRGRAIRDLATSCRSYPGIVRVAVRKAHKPTMRDG